ncbi:MAG: flavodoxin family protein [candidate division Zixibacteria bacterium]|nr:flavodoxin family protein [candidate division Zixibacteria bacterium]
MTKIIGLSGSPVTGSSTEILVQEVLRGAGETGADTEIIILNEYDIMPCQACGQSPEDGYCFFSDGMDELYSKFIECDAIVMGSPIYFDSVSAQMKLFIDRTNCFRTINPKKPCEFSLRFQKKCKGAIVLVGGEREEYEFARRVIGGFFIWAGVENIGLVTHSNDSLEKGTAADDSLAMQEAFRLGNKLMK